MVNYDKTKELVNEVFSNNSELVPVFYVISGSHSYGTNGPNSDTDIKGFHIAPAEKHLKINPPKEQVIVNQSNITKGYEEFRDIDFVSYEAKKFSKLLHSGNFNAMEILFNKNTVINNYEKQINQFREVVKRHLPGNVYKTYIGMAKSMYGSNLKSYSQDGYSAKDILRAVRGTYGAINTVENKEIEPNILELAEKVNGDTELVKQLIRYKRNSERVPEKVAEKVRSHIGPKLNKEFNTELDKNKFRGDINQELVGLYRKAGESG